MEEYLMNFSELQVEDSFSFFFFEKPSLNHILKTYYIYSILNTHQKHCHYL